MAQTAFHPGEHLQEELDAMSLESDTLAIELGVSSELLIELLAQRQSMTAELALRLAHYFGTTAQYWLNLQSSFDLEVAERVHGREIEALPTLQAA